MSGEIVAANDGLAGAPDSINADAYDSWLFKIKPAADASIDRLLDAAAYGNVDRRITLSIDGAASRWRTAAETAPAGIHMKLEHPDRLMNRSSLSLAALECHDAFVQRHIGPDRPTSSAMLDALGFATRAALIDAVDPANIRRKETLPLGRVLRSRRAKRKRWPS